MKINSSALRIAILYALLGILWILASDLVVARLLARESSVAAQTYKGIAYVLVTGTLVYYLVQRFSRDLIRTNARFRALFASSPDALLVIGDKGELLDANDQWLARYGYGREELGEKTVTGLVKQGEGEKEEARMAEALDKAIRFESTHLSKAGEAFPVEISAQPVELNGRRCVLCSVRDIGARKRAEESLRESEEQLRAFFESPVIGTLFGDVHGNIFQANEEFLRIVGYSREELETGAIKWDAITPPEFLPLDGAHIEEAKEKGACTPYQKQYIRKDGTRIWIMAGYILLEPDRERSIAFILDLSELKRTETALRESETLYRLLAENTLDCIWKLDSELRFTYVNPAVVRLFHYRPQEWIGTRLTDHTDDVHAEHIREVIDAELKNGTDSRGIFFETEIRTLEGIPLPVEVSLGVNRGEDDRVVSFQGMARDISERKKLEAQLLQAQKMEAIGLLAGGVAHDFNNILQSLQGYSQLLLSELEPGTETYEYASEIFAGTERAANLTSQLLAFSRQQIIRPRNVELNRVVENLARMIERTIGERIEVHFRPTPHSTVVRADPGQIEQVILNLCVNARDAMPGGGQVQIETGRGTIDDLRLVEEEGLSATEFVTLTVSDSGTGMDDETLRRVFEPFFTTKEKGKGTGLGLSMAYGIVRQHGGTIRASSKRDAGTKFEIYLPAGALIPDQEPLAPISLLQRGTETVLVAEDDESLRKLLGRILTQAGYKVLLAADGDEAIKIGRRHIENIDLVLLDIVMPRRTGDEVWGELRKLRPGLPALFSSGYSPDAAGNAAIIEEGIEVLQKPYTPSILLESVRRALDLK